MISSLIKHLIYSLFLLGTVNVWSSPSIISDLHIVLSEEGTALLNINDLMESEHSRNRTCFKLSFSRNQTDTIRHYDCTDQGLKMFSIYVYYNSEFERNQLAYVTIDDKNFQCVDQDHDGFLAYIDCDDFNAKINPNKMDLPDNGIDEDCSGKDSKSVPVLSKWGMIILMLIFMIFSIRILQSTPQLSTELKN